MAKKPLAPCPSRADGERCNPAAIGVNYNGTVWRCEKHSIAYVIGPNGKLLTNDAKDARYAG